MASIAPPIQPAAGLGVSALGIAKRGLLKYLRTPQLVVLGTVQGALFLLIFRYVFGGAIGTEGVSYVNFLIPGFVTTSILWSGRAPTSCSPPSTWTRPTTWPAAS